MQISMQTDILYPKIIIRKKKLMTLLAFIRSERETDFNIIEVFVFFPRICCKNFPRHLEHGIFLTKAFPRVILLSAFVKLLCTKTFFPSRTSLLMKYKCSDTLVIIDRCQDVDFIIGYMLRKKFPRFSFADCIQF